MMSLKSDYLQMAAYWILSALKVNWSDDKTSSSPGAYVNVNSWAVCSGQERRGRLGETFDSFGKSEFLSDPHFHTLLFPVRRWTVNSWPGLCLADTGLYFRDFLYIWILHKEMKSSHVQIFFQVQASSWDWGYEVNHPDQSERKLACISQSEGRRKHCDNRSPMSWTLHWIMGEEQEEGIVGM